MTRVTLRRPLLSSVLSAALLCPSVAVANAATTPDPTFGANGVVTAPTWTSFDDVVAMPDGGSAAVAVTLQESGDIPAAVVRHDRSGRPVAAFGDGGTVVLSRAGHRIWLGHVEHGPHGTLVVVGWFTSVAGASGLVVARLSATTGAFDPTFATGGVLLQAMAPTISCSRRDGSVLPDGRVMVVCWRVSPGSAQGPVVAMVDARGRLQTAFGVRGLASVALGAGAWNQAGTSTVAPDGRIVIGVTVGGALGAVRLLPSGARDRAFSGDGIATRAPFRGASAGPSTVVVQPGGRVVVAAGLDYRGFTDERYVDTAVVRFTASGANDMSFNGGRGSARIPALVTARTLRLPDGSLLLVGADVNGDHFGDSSPSRGRVAHLRASGVPDTAWGAGGVSSLSAPGAVRTAWSSASAGSGSALTLSGWTSSADIFAPTTATLMRVSGVSAVRRQATIEAGPSWDYGVFRGCGATAASACRIGTTWYLMGNAWPLEAHDPPRVVVQVDRRSASGRWVRTSTLPTFVTDVGNFRAAGSPRSVGLYRIRAAVPASVSSLVTYSPWRYVRR